MEFRVTFLDNLLKVRPGWATPPLLLPLEVVEWFEATLILRPTVGTPPWLYECMTEGLRENSSLLIMSAYEKKETEERELFNLGGDTGDSNWPVKDDWDACGLAFWWDIWLME